MQKNANPSGRGNNMKSAEYYLEHIDFNAKAKPDFSTLFADPKVHRNLVNDLAAPFKHDRIDKIACPEAMGFLFGTGVAQKLGVGMIPIRKAGKLPLIKSRIARHTFTDYTREKNAFEVNKTLINKGDRVLLVDDWSETGGQLKGLVALLKKRGAIVAGISLLGFNEIRKTRSLDQNYKLHAIFRYTMEGERDLEAPLVQS